MNNLSLRVVDNRTGTDLSITLQEQPAYLGELVTLSKFTEHDPGAPLVKIGADGCELPESATDHVAVYVRSRNIWITARKINAKRLTWSKADEACKAVKLAGFNDWRMPELADLEAIRDLTRYDPAANTDFFPGLDPAAHWSATPWAREPSSDAWHLYFGDGDADTDYRGYECFVLAVRSASAPGQ